MSDLLDSAVEMVEAGEAQTAPLIDSPHEALSLESPLDVLLLYDPDVNSGDLELYPWQVDLLRLIGRDWTSAEPFMYFLAAVNGSGKDRFIVAPTIIWLLIAKTDETSVTTSSSGVQLTRQTEAYVRRLAENVNRVNGKDYIELKQRYYKCPKSGSEAILFATDEPGKAEGYHPKTARSGLTLIVNEVKSVDGGITEALHRCTGYNRWLNVSSPGLASGFFYDGFMSAPPSRKMEVVAEMCPHISKATLDAVVKDYGANSAIANSMIYCKFTSAQSSTVITMEDVNECIVKYRTAANSMWLRRDMPKRAGLDLANGGDENVLAVIWGNRLMALETFICNDTETTADHLITLFMKHGLDESYIWADAGGLGIGILDKLKRRKWNVNRIWMQSPARDKMKFVNMGAELWFRVARLFQEKLAWIIDDDKLKKQLYTREYDRTNTSGKYQLESKVQARARGLPSPDRADAYVLAHCGLTVRDYIKIDPDVERARIKRLTLDEVLEEEAYGAIEVESHMEKANRIFGSVAKAMRWRR